MIGAASPSPRRSPLAGALVCTRCGSRAAIDESVLDLARAELVRALGFEPDRGELVLSGRCAKCRASGFGAASAWGRA